MSILSIFVFVCVAAALVAMCAAVFATCKAQSIKAAEKAMRETELRFRMHAAWDVAVKQAQLMDAGTKALEVKLGRRAPTGTKLAYGRIN